MKIFNREFQHLSAHLLQELHTLQEEGAIYAQFWQEDSNDFRFCRIRLTPAEIVDYVDASFAFDEFKGLLQQYGDSSLAVAHLSNPQVRNRVEEYNRWTISIGQDETAFCFAAFLGKHLEALTCGTMPERYEFLSRTYTGDRRFILAEILEMFPTSVALLANRMRNRPSYDIEEEQDVRDLLYAIVKSVFPDSRIEEHTRIHAGGAKIIDIVIPRISTVIEVKYVRNPQHAKEVANELRIDFESYHIHQDCKTLIAYVWDPNGYLVDRSNFINDLRGLRAKGESRFKVEVMVKP